MRTIKDQWEAAVAAALNRLAQTKGGGALEVTAGQIVTERPPDPNLGDISFPMFKYAKLLRSSPASIAEEVNQLLSSEDAPSGKAENAGPYVNVLLDVAEVAAETVKAVMEEGEEYGRSGALMGQKTMIEFSSPNTNKPLHLGHLRNDAIGESVSRILLACGADVRKVNLINDRGIHICKSMLAYSKFGGGSTPESVGKKSDHFVGDYYVRFAQWAKEDPQAEEQAREMLRKWEDGDTEVLELWRKMNGWAIEGIQATYRKTGISFDTLYFESETYSAGKAEVLKGLDQGLFYREEDGSVWVDLSEEGLDKKVLLRGDGTSLYVTQDIGTVLARHEDFPFDRLIYVVASEQRHHFRVLFSVLTRLGYPWAKSLHHLSYGMVNLPEGKMKSREGTVVDADDLITELSAMAGEEIRAKGREEEVGDVAGTAGAIALGALNYYLLQVSPVKDMVFKSEESISFTGNTGPYLQYMGTRISSVLRKYEERAGQFNDGRFDPSLIQRGDEWELVKLVAGYAEVVERAAQELSPAIITGYLYDLSQTFSRYYHDNPVLHNDDVNLVVTRVTLSRAVLQVLKNAFWLVGVPFLDRM